jgi:hypothetical protein
LQEHRAAVLLQANHKEIDMSTTARHFAVVKRPGFRGHEMTVLSAHATPEAAAKASAKHVYTDARGQRVYPCEVVRTNGPTAKRATLWDDGRAFDDALAGTGWRRV